MKIKKSITLEEKTVKKIEDSASCRDMKFSQAIELKLEQAENFYSLYEQIDEVMNEQENNDFTICIIEQIMKMHKYNYDK